MAIKTTLEQLEEVQAAITKVMSGQDVTLNGKRLTYANLSALETREEKLLARYRAESGTGGLSINIGTHRRDY
jgi:hypothetical protein